MPDTPDELRAIRVRATVNAPELAVHDRKVLVAHIDALTAAVEALVTVRGPNDVPMVSRAAVLDILGGEQ